jgi:pantoate--beta-alanine ligase
VRIVRDPDAARAIVRAWRGKGERIGFVPTMGALHDGHRSLLRRARRECDRLVASIFVNPLQFGPREDLSRYPRSLARDRSMLIAEGTDLLYNPSARAMYPPGFTVRIEVPGLGDGLEGASRPGHFAGVATVVAKLLNTLEPDRMYLGQKDAQQAIVLSKMVRDLDLGVRVVVCPTVRETDGLALSSRNAYLTRPERAWAPSLHRVLRETAAALRTGEMTPRGAEASIRRRLANGPGKLDYARAVDAETLGPVRTARPILLSLAYHLGKARLIDNVVVRRAKGR